MSVLKRSLPLLALVLAVACGGPLERTATIDLELGEDTSALHGVSRSAAGTLWVLSEVLLHELDLEGRALRTIDLAELQPEGDAYRDVLDLGDGTFAASHTLAVARLFPDENRSEDYFCLEPGSFAPVPVEPAPNEPGPLTRMNPSLTADLDADRIYATPRVFEDGALIDNKLVEYTVSGGEFLRALTLPGELRPEAIAVRGSTLFAAAGGEITVLDIANRDIEITDQYDTDLIDARGALVDDDKLMVLDAATSQLAVFGL